MTLSRAGTLLLLIAALVLVTACATSTGASTTSESAALSREARSDCGQILGTAFRSVDERSWFEQNCSKWPLIDVPNTPNTATVQLPPECAAMRGKPYTSSEQRTWYLANCNGATAQTSSRPGSVPNPPGGSQFSTSSQFSEPGAGPTPTSGSDRTDCNEVRGTAYRSEAERVWFMANCPNNPSAQTTPATTQPSQSSRGGLPPSSSNDRTDCFAIGGTPYRSTNEQAWFLANCFPPRNQNSNSNNDSNRGGNSNRDRDD